MLLSLPPFITYNSNQLKCKHILLQKNCFTQTTFPLWESYHQLQGDQAPYTPETYLPCLLRPQLITVKLKLIKSILKGSLVLSWAEIFTISFCFLVLKNKLCVLSLKSDLHLISLYNINLNQTIKGHESKGIDCQLKKLSIVIQILLVNIIENVRRTV